MKLENPHYFRMTIEAMRKAADIDHIEPIDAFRMRLEYRPEFSISGMLDINRITADEPMQWQNGKLLPLITAASIREALRELHDIRTGDDISRRLKFYYTKNQGG